MTMDVDDWNDSKNSDSRLSSMYRPPLDLLFQGSFEDAKSVSSQKNLWLLVNLQSRTEFASHVLNRDVWSNPIVSEAVESSFILWQVYDDTTQGQKISSFYKLNDSTSLPVVLLIDPVTGQKMRMWSGVIEAQSLVEDFIKFMDVGPRQNIASLARKRRREEEQTCLSRKRIVQVTEEEKKTCLGFPLLTGEPKEDCDRSVTCNLCVRFPDGRRKQRRFLKNEPIQLLWSFCSSHMSENKAFKLVHAVPGASKTLDYGAKATFHQSGLDNTMISVIWE